MGGCALSIVEGDLGQPTKLGNVVLMNRHEVGLLN